MNKYEHMLFDINHLRLSIFFREEVSIDFSYLKSEFKNESIVKFETEDENAPKIDDIYIYQLPEHKRLECKLSKRRLEARLHFVQNLALDYNQIIKEFDSFLSILGKIINSLNKNTVFRLALGMVISTEVINTTDYYKKLEIFLPYIKITDDSIDHIEIKSAKKSFLPISNQIKLNRMIQCSPSKLIQIDAINQTSKPIKDVILINFDYNTENNTQIRFNDISKIIDEIKSTLSE